MTGVLEIKTQGNQFFKDCKYDEALACYAKALSIDSISAQDKEVLYKNCSQCYLNQGKFAKAVDYANKSLELSPNDPKALFRRCQAFEKLDKLSEAHADAVQLFKLDPSNKAVHPILKRLEIQVKSIVGDKESLMGRIGSMFELLESPHTEQDKLLQAVNNLIALVREDNAGSRVWKHAGIKVVFSLCRSCKYVNVVDALHRLIGCIVRDDMKKGVEAFESLSHQHVISLLFNHDPVLTRSGGRLIQSLLGSMTQVDDYNERRIKHQEHVQKKKLGVGRMPPYELPTETRGYVEEGLRSLTRMINSRKLTAIGRDCVLEILIRFVGRSDGVGWQLKFIEEGGLKRCLELAAVTDKTGVLVLSDNCRMTTAVLLTKVYDDLVADKHREDFRSIALEFVGDLLSDDMVETKVEAASVIGLLFQGPFEAGQAIMTKEGLMEGLIMLAQSDNVNYQKIALDAIIQASRKKAKCASVVSVASPVLQELYKNGKDAIKIRALVGLCKFGSIGGSDASYMPFTEGSTAVLAKSCRRYLTNYAGERDMAHWAVEGLVYLTLDADIKEELVQDEAAIKAMFALAKSGDTESLYAIASVLVNTTNSYDTPEILPEMKELAEYSKTHIPEDHELDAKEFSDKRVSVLMSLDLAGALYAMAKGAEKLATFNTKELISRVYLQAASEEKHRGTIVQAGGGKGLIDLALKNTPVGRGKASQALAKLCISIDPRTAFPGQRSLEVIRPLMQLLDIEMSSLQNFEALLALTNLASLDNNHRGRILADMGYNQIEHYMFEDHEMLVRAAVECACNLANHPRMTELFLADNDRVKMMLLFAAEAEDMAMSRAACGTLAVLSADDGICVKITKVNNWVELLQSLVANEDIPLQHRAAHLLANLIGSSRDLAQFLVGTNTFEVLMALSRLPMDDRSEVKKCAQRSLDACVEFGLIQPST